MTSQYGEYAFRDGLEGYMHVRAYTRQLAWVATCTHACTHKPISNDYCFSTETIIRERASVLRYTYIAPSCM
jgi:hypothetical protein